MIQGSGNTEYEILSSSSDSWTDAQILDLYTSSTSIARLNLSTTTAIQGLAEQVQLPDFADSIEDFTEEDSNSESMATGRSPKQPRTESAENGLDMAALMEKLAEKAGDRAAEKSSEGFRTHAEGFRTYMDTKIDSMMEQMDKKIEDKIDKKLVPVIDRISALEEKALTSSTRSGPSSSSDGTSGSAAGPVLFAPSYLEIKGWCAFKDRDTHGLTEGQAKEFIAKLRQGIGSDLDSLIARVGAARVRNTKIICYLRNPSVSNCKQIREAMCAYIEKENIKLGGATPYVVEEKPVWRQEQQRIFGKALGVVEHYAQEARKQISSEWYPFYQIYVHESKDSHPIPLLSTSSGAPVVNPQGAEMLGVSVDKLAMACRRGTA